MSISNCYYELSQHVHHINTLLGSVLGLLNQLSMYATVPYWITISQTATALYMIIGHLYKYGGGGMARRKASLTYYKSETIQILYLVQPTTTKLMDQVASCVA